MIRALFTWSLKISAALYVRHFHFLHTIEEAEVLNQNEFDNFDNYNLNLLLIKRIILRSRKQFPTCSLDEFKPFPEYLIFTRQTRIRNVSPDSLCERKEHIYLDI